jgi:hypothetical protein
MTSSLSAANRYYPLAGHRPCRPHWVCRRCLQRAASTARLLPNQAVVRRAALELTGHTAGVLSEFSLVTARLISGAADY